MLYAMHLTGVLLSLSAINILNRILYSFSVNSFVILHPFFKDLYHNLAYIGHKHDRKKSTKLKTKSWSKIHEDTKYQGRHNDAMVHHFIFGHTRSCPVL